MLSTTSAPLTASRSLAALGMPEGRRSGSHPRTAQPAATRSAAIRPPASPRPSTATSITLLRPARAAPAGRRTARPRRSAAASRLPAAPARARGEAPPAMRSAGSAIAPSQSMTTRSPGRIAAPPTTTGTSSRPTSPFVAPCARTKRAQIGRPTAASSSRSRTAASTSSPATPRACACVASNSPTNAYGAGAGLVSTRTSPARACAINACTIVLSCGAQTAIRAGPATREPGTTCVSGTSTIPTRPAASCTVATPSRANARVVGHRASATTGISRWNASA